jgi:hypothetical protein
MTADGDRDPDPGGELPDEPDLDERESDVPGERNSAEEFDFADREERWPSAEAQDVAERLGQVGRVAGDVPSLAHALRSLRFTADFLKDIESNEDVPDVAPFQAYDTVRNLRELFRRLRVVAIAINERRGVTPSLEVELEEAAVRLDVLSDRLLREFGDVLRRIGTGGRISASALPIVDRYSELLEARRLTHETRGARDEAVRVLDVTRRAAGVTGETSLAVHFGNYAASERKTANLLRLGTVAVLLGVTVLAAVLLFRKGANPTTTEDIAKLSLTIPLAALATYLGREASRHRRVSQWAGELEVQLLTVDAFTETLSGSLREQIRSDLGRRVFTTQVGVANEGEVAPSTIADAAGLIEKVADLVKNSAARDAGKI